jgi:hypothetical protein
MREEFPLARVTETAWHRRGSHSSTQRCIKYPAPEFPLTSIGVRRHFDEQTPDRRYEMSGITGSKRIESWPEESREAAQLVVQKHGEPDEADVAEFSS